MILVVFISIVVIFVVTAAITTAIDRRKVSLPNWKTPMKVLFGTIGVVGVLVAVAVLTTGEGALNLAFGWVAFLRRVLPNISVDPLSACVGTVATILFGLMIHFIGRSWRRRTSVEPGDSVTCWKIRWTATILSVVILLFAAGISIVGITHQIAWLATTDRPLMTETIEHSDSANMNLRQIGLGIHMSANDFGRWPSQTYSKPGSTIHSWETNTLIYIGYAPNELDTTRPWNDPVNQKLFKCVLRVFINPELRAEIVDADGYGLNHFAANARVVRDYKGVDFETLSNSSNLILVGEVNSHFKPWGNPANLRDPAIGINRSPNGFGGPRGAGGAQFLMADGSVRFISAKIDPAALRALSSPELNE